MREPAASRSILARLLISMAAMLLPLAAVAGLELAELQASSRNALAISRDTIAETAALTDARDSLRALESAVAGTANGMPLARVQVPQLIATAELSLKATARRLDSPQERRLQREATAAYHRALAQMQGRLRRVPAGAKTYPLLGFHLAIESADTALADTAKVSLRELSARDKAFRAGHRRRVAILIVLLAAALGGAVLIALRLRRDIRRPLDDLREASRHLGEGKLDHRVEPGRWVEFKELAESFNEMGTRLAASRRDLLHQAFHDDLTGLPNRALLIDRAEQALVRAQRHPEPRPQTALMLLDVDRFKLVNDTLGHFAGDGLLVEVGHRLRGALRPHDTVARLGGDEFAVLLEDLGAPLDAEHAAERLLLAFAQPCDVDGREIALHASVGVVVAQPHDSADDLIRNADVAMYRAKADGRGGYRMFEASMREEVVERARFEQELAPAIEDGQLVLHYQPLTDVATGRLEGVEALVRWNHPTRGLLPPGAFIGIAEETDLIGPLGRWVLVEAAGELRRLLDEHPGLDLRMSVNVSPHQFREPGFTGEVARLLSELELPEGSLVIEITEGLLLGDERAAERLRDLREAGVLIAIDDFGTGYSALSYLQRFPVDILKIDRSFMSSGDERIVRAIVDLGRALGITTVAEGVETIEQLDRLRELRCDVAQGFLLSRPLAAGALRTLIDGLDGGRIYPRPRVRSA